MLIFVFLSKTEIVKCISIGIENFHEKATLGNFIDGFLLSTTTYSKFYWLMWLTQFQNNIIRYRFEIAFNDEICIFCNLNQNFHCFMHECTMNWMLNWMSWIVGCFNITFILSSIKININLVTQYIIIHVTFSLKNFQLFRYNKLMKYK